MALKTVQPNHSGTRALRRVAHGFIDKAARRLAHSEVSDKEVHDARKDLQKSRAALRLLRAAVGERVYRRENMLLRNAARALNSARDAKVLAQALQGLRGNGSALRQDNAVAELERMLQAEEAQVQGELLENGAPEAESTLKQVAERASRWRLGRQGWSELGPAFKRIYKAARRAMPAPHARTDDAALHEWRKRTKYLRYALQMLEPIRPGGLSTLVKQARSLSECLGDNHDLALLALKAQDFARGNQTSVAPLLHAIERRQSRLTTRALATGARLYRPKPGAMSRQLGRYWHSWRQNSTQH